MCNVAIPRHNENPLTMNTVADYNLEMTPKALNNSEGPLQESALFSLLQ